MNELSEKVKFLAAENLVTVYLLCTHKNENPPKTRINTWVFGGRF